MSLFNDSEVFQKERPVKPTDAQLELFYSRMAKDMIEEDFSDSEEDEIIHDLKELYPFYDNGYEMAKKLEKYRMEGNYKIDTAFCEWLDGLEYEYQKINTENIKAWVKAHNPQPKYAKGTKLLINEKLSYKLEKDMIVYVNGGRPEEAVYWINTDPNEYGGTVLAYELVENKCTPINAKI